MFKLPGGWGLNPPVVCLPPPPQTRCPGIPWGVSFNPPPLLMMLNRLCVMTMTMNRHAVKLSTPALIFFTIQTLGHQHLRRRSHQPTPRVLHRPPPAWAVPHTYATVATPPGLEKLVLKNLGF
jgi:hypothetical protein